MYHDYDHQPASTTIMTVVTIITMDANTIYVVVAITGLISDSY